ncbi:flavin-dependent oxidoreductase [Vineibacter terrae]|uniref:Flavin-dependent oxidoreductase n=1 Tax=Vineibacter terrae TaxID=2586908 RepID=A0A5C8PSS4_9HYPH|nr:flavin-dependent oxidoreductase [Vineibacter terrae]TXL78762.1 flavin-dependent oxidoreductase [Vineibacter terrae]
MDDVIIVGAGIGGLTLALTLHRAGIACRIYEAAEAIRPVGVGVNLLPHAVRELTGLGLEAALSRVAVTTQEAVFFNRFGQLIYREPLGRLAGFDWPQFSIHRGDLQAVLLDAVTARIGAGRLHLGWRCIGAEPDARGAVARFRRAADDSELPVQRGAIVVACDGIHSVIRKQLHPGEGDPLYSGYNMWRGVTRWPPFLSGASMVRAGWLATGKMVIYPIRDAVDDERRQLVNWVVEIETPHYKRRDWNRPGRLEDFLPAVADWRFDWLDVPAFLRAADTVLEFPMVDQDPLPRWSFGRITLLGDAAHPMVPRGSNGAGQAILDARALADALATHADPGQALQHYEAQRREVTSNIVLANRRNPPDAILREVYLRTGDRPFNRIEDVIAHEELVALSDGYKRISGSSREALGARPG